jgi:ubiquinone/menaquinone biosynthesis C-methylase UbiE
MTAGGSAADDNLSYFGVQAGWGVTKHLGGRKATDRLVQLCAITRESTVLEVGCGVGVSACYLARSVGCSLVSIDLSERMITWARRRAERQGLADRIVFQAADVQDLPFAAGRFDAVISESVTAFAPDKAKAVSEYKRVLRPGGCAGLTEASWVRPAPAELVEFLSRSMQGAVFLEPDGWLRLLEDGGFVDLHSEVFRLTVMSQLSSDLSGQTLRDVADRFRAMASFIGQYLTDPNVRRYAKTLMPSRQTMKDLFTYYGYGIYTGRNP